MSDCPRCESCAVGVELDEGAPVISEPGVLHVPLLGNPNTGKTTLFNSLCGLRHKTSNFPGTTQEARIGVVRLGASGNGATVHLVDLPGIYSLELDLMEARICREVLAGRLSPRGEPIGDPEAICIVADATNLARNLVFVGEALRRRLPTVVALNMIDLARAEGRDINLRTLEEQIGCRVIAVSARKGDGLQDLAAALRTATVPTHTPPGDQAELELWADRLASKAMQPAGDAAFATPRASLTDRLDPLLVSPWTGVPIFALVMVALFYAIFSIAKFPMDGIDWFFGYAADKIEFYLPPGILRDLIARGVVVGIGATAVFVPQICLLFFLISLLEDTGYLARAALLMHRALRPFGLPGHAFVPLLSSHACALPGIMSTRVIPDRRERLATILVAPFMTCSARLPVYVLITSLLFKGKPLYAGLAFVGCYMLGALAGLVSAFIARRTILKGPSRAMVLELPTYKVPSLRTALATTIDRGWVFLKNAGTNILAICVVLWWLGSYPHVPPPESANLLREQATSLQAIADTEADKQKSGEMSDRAKELGEEADRLTAANAKANSFIGRIGKAVQPVFAPVGYDWQLTVGVLTSFAAREVFVSTMAVVTSAGDEDPDVRDQGIIDSIASAPRSDGKTPIFTPATCWSVLVFFVLAMQCLPTLAVTAKEAGGIKWALLQLGWMSVIAYAAAFIVYQGLRFAGVS
ncbi:MAG: ferrous iron transporter B [Phycisphaeraceae bacterium]|nr:ferrous iron transporter B [Phycisphaeraceae bacterium]